jgi:hypothetical protein
MAESGQLLVSSPPVFGIKHCCAHRWKSLLNARHPRHPSSRVPSRIAHVFGPWWLLADILNAKAMLRVPIVSISSTAIGAATSTAQ